MNLRDEMRGYWLRNTVLGFGLQSYKYVNPTKSNNLIFSPAGLHHMLSLLSEMLDNENDKTLLLELLNIPASRYNVNVLKMKWSGYRRNVLCNALKFAIRLAFFSTSEPILLYRCISNLLVEHYVNIFNIDSTITGSKALPTKVDEWMNEVTNGNVKSVDVGTSTKILALSTVHFSLSFVRKTCWSAEENDFFVDNETSVTVDFLVTQQMLTYCNSEELNAQIVQLDYDFPGFHLLILLPHDLSKLEEIITHLKDTTVLTNCLEGSTKTSMILRLPRFVINSELDVSAFLKAACPKIGDSWADMKSVQVPFDTVKQYNHLKIVHPEPNDAAIKRRKNSPFILNINRPFMFIVLDEGLPIFMGRICDPSQN